MIYPYTESATTSSSLLIGNKPYLVAENGLLEVHGASDLDGQLVLVDGASSEQITYDIIAYSDDACSAHARSGSVTSSNGIALDEWLVSSTTSLEINFRRASESSSDSTDLLISGITIFARAVDKIVGYRSANRSRLIKAEPVVLAWLREEQNGVRQSAFIAAHSLEKMEEPAAKRGYLLPVPVHIDVQDVFTFAHAIDRFSEERPAETLTNLSDREVYPDSAPPELILKSPLAGMVVRPKQRFNANLGYGDNTEGWSGFEVTANGGSLIRQNGPIYRKGTMTVPIEVAESFESGNLELLFTATDPSGTPHTQSLQLPLMPNEPPTVSLDEFASYQVNAGDRIQLDQKLYGTLCPSPNIRSDNVSSTIQFDQTTVTEYELVLTDTLGQTATRRFIIHPLDNMAPGVRITSPADGQFVVAGTFQIKVGVVSTDDRQLGSNAVSVYVNDRRVPMLSNDEDEIGGPAIIMQAFAEIYDEIESRYTIDMANDYGTRNSPWAQEQSLVIEVPAGLIRSNEPVLIRAVVEDSDGAGGSDEVVMIAAADEINPEVAISEPVLGFGHPTVYASLQGSMSFNRTGNLLLL